MPITRMNRSRASLLVVSVVVIGLGLAACAYGDEVATTSSTPTSTTSSEVPKPHPAGTYPKVLQVECYKDRVVLKAEAVEAQRDGVHVAVSSDEPRAVYGVTLVYQEDGSLMHVDGGFVDELPNVTPSPPPGIVTVTCSSPATGQQSAQVRVEDPNNFYRPVRLAALGCHRHEWPQPQPRVRLGDTGATPELAVANFEANDEGSREVRTFDMGYVGAPVMVLYQDGEPVGQVAVWLFRHPNMWAAQVPGTCSP
jgi:hypothetical protein